jgi:hypothetical protein
MGEPVKPDPTCPVCGTPIPPESRVFFQHGDLFHVRCVREARALASMEQRDRVAEMLKAPRARRAESRRDATPEP